MSGSRVVASQVAALCLMGSGLAGLAAQGVLSRLHNEGALLATIRANVAGWQLSHQLLLLWLLLLPTAIVGLLDWLGERRTAYALLGGGLALGGVVINALLTGVDFVLTPMALMEQSDVMAQLHRRLVEGIVLPLDRVDTALPLGLLLLAISFYRSRQGSQWATAAWLIGLAIPLVGVGRLLATAMQALGLLGLGWQRVRAPAQREPRSYQRAELMALFITIAFLPGLLFSVERALFALLVVFLLLLPELRATAARKLVADAAD